MRSAVKWPEFTGDRMSYIMRNAYKILVGKCKWNCAVKYLRFVKKCDCYTAIIFKPKN
jgi:hypothetical protein